jgi:hypothetical protein
MTEKSVINTLLIRREVDFEAWESFVFGPKDQSHPGSIGNMLIMKCYEDKEVLDRLECLYGLPGIAEVIVAQGDTDWYKYLGVDKFPSITDDQFLGTGKYGSGVAQFKTPGQPPGKKADKKAKKAKMS